MSALKIEGLYEIKGKVLRSSVLESGRVPPASRSTWEPVESLQEPRHPAGLQGGTEILQAERHLRHTTLAVCRDLQPRAPHHGGAGWVKSP